ncbi:MAG: tetratricopeptide repeat protein [Planctomycetota bacterium]|jgi:predicted Zn-dependent protease
MSFLSRSILLTAVVVLLLGGMVVAFHEIYQRGLTREGLFERAQRAYREMRFDDAIRLANETLESEPRHEHARRLLAEALLGARRWDDARVQLNLLLEDEKHGSFAVVRFCQLALRDGDLDEAESLARTIADSSPEFAYRVLALIQDHRGLATDSWRQRLAASATMRGLASLVEVDAAKADAYLFAADVSLEVAPVLPQSKGLLRQARKDLELAAVHAGAAGQADRAYEYEYTMGRIRILSENEQEAELGAKGLRKYTSGVRRRETAIGALAKYHLAREEWAEALDLVRELKDTYAWHRILWTVGNSPHDEIALKVFDAGPLEEGPERALMRADLLLRRKDQARRTEGREALEAIVRDAGSDTGLVLRALLTLAVRTDVETARAAAEAADVQARDDYRITAFLATLLSIDEEDKDRGLELARQLAQATDSTSQSRDVIRMLGRTGGGALERYLETQVAKGGQTGLQHRLQRALTTMARARRGEDSDQSKELRASVLADVKALEQDGLAGKATLVASFNLAASLGEAEMAGRLLGRAITMEGPPDALDARVLRLAVSLEDDEVLQRLVAGVRRAADSSPAGAYVSAYADAMEKRAENRPALIAALEAAAAEQSSRGLALELASRVALGENDLATAERLARAALEAQPGSDAALEILGGVLLRRGAFAQVLSLYDDRERIPLRGKFQVVDALMALKRTDKGLTVAREIVAETPRSVDAHVLLARVYLDRKEERKALSVLNMAPTNPLVAHMRATLLIQLEDYAMAERLYQVLLISSRFKDVQAWQGLKLTMAEQKRTGEFVAISRRILASDYLDDDKPVRALVHYLRGVALESEGKARDSLADYEAALQDDDRMWYAYNNAAWHIARLDRTRIETARTYIARALELNPDEPSVHDTAAEVYATLEDFDGALRHVDRALALASGARAASFMVHKARILVRFDRDDPARTLLEKVEGEYADTPAAKLARELLWEIERKHLPEEKPLEVEAPEDEKEDAQGCLERDSVTDPGKEAQE